MLPLRHGMIIQIPPRAGTAQRRPVPQTVRLARPGHEAGISVPGCHSRSWESVVPGPASVPKRETQHAQGIRPQGVLVEPGRQPERARQIAAEYLDPQHRVCGGQPHAQQPRHTGHRRSPADQPETDAVRGLSGGRRASTAENSSLYITPPVVMPPRRLAPVFVSEMVARLTCLPRHSAGHLLVNAPETSLRCPHHQASSADAEMNR